MKESETCDKVIECLLLLMMMFNNMNQTDILSHLNLRIRTENEKNQAEEVEGPE